MYRYSVAVALALGLVAADPRVALSATDSDGDGVFNAYDNCRQTVNPDGFDSNNDGYGNHCDADYDNNGVVGGYLSADYYILSNALGSQRGDANWNEDVDCNGDGVINTYETTTCWGPKIGQAPGPSGVACAGLTPCCAPIPPCSPTGDPQMPDCSYAPALPTPAYPTCAGRTILIDQTHTELGARHRVATLSPFNDGYFASLYWAFGKLLAADGYEVRDSDVPFSSLLPLKHGEILVIMIPRNPLTPAEIDSVVSWVANGGRLMVILDHPPYTEIAGLMAAMIPGFSMRPGASYLFDPIAPVFGSFIAEPVQSFAGAMALCSSTPGADLDPCPPQGAPLLRLPTGTVNGLGQNLEGYFEGLAFQFGDGKVYVSGESEMFTAQIKQEEGGAVGMQLPGIANQQLLLNVIHWLDGIPPASDH